MWSGCDVTAYELAVAYVVDAIAEVRGDPDEFSVARVDELRCGAVPIAP